MDIESYILGASYTTQEITKVNQTITNVTNQVTSGIKTISQQNGNQLVFTLNDDTVVTLTVTGLSQENYSTIEKQKLALLNSEILSQFTYVNGDLLFNGSPIVGGSVDLSDYYTQTQINNLLNNKVDKVTGKSLVDDSEITRLSTVENYDDTNVNNHMSNSNIHATLSEKSIWNNKADISDIPDVANKLEIGNIIAGDNISLNVVDNNITINSTSISANTNDSKTINSSDWIFDETTNTYKITIAHNLNTKNIIVAMYNGIEKIELIGVTRIDLNTIQLENIEPITGELIINYSSSSDSIKSSKWKGRTFVTFGDSITWYDGHIYTSSSTEYGSVVKGYQSYMREKLGCIVINAGTDGYTMPLINSVIKTYDFSNIDAVTLTSGANDFRNSNPIGTIQAIGSTFNNTTFCGALQESIEHILNFNPEIKIYLLTPIKGWDSNNIIMPSTYPDVIKNIANLYSLSACDWYNNSGINEITKLIYIGDVSASLYHLHPTLKGYERMSNILIPFLENS